MTDRIKGLTVTLEPNIREDDAQAIIDAIKMVRGVLSVEKHVADLDHHLAVEQAKLDLRKVKMSTPWDWETREDGSQVIYDYDNKRVTLVDPNGNARWVEL